MKINIDLLAHSAHILSPRPVRVKLVWLMDDNDHKAEPTTEKKKGKSVLYERTFKIDTSIREQSSQDPKAKGKYFFNQTFLDKQGGYKRDGSIQLNLTELLKQLFNEPGPSGRSFDKKAKKIIRSQYKLVSEKLSDARDRIDSSQSERKDIMNRSALSALAAENASTNESENHRFGASSGMHMAQPDGKKIMNYYNSKAYSSTERGIISHPNI